MQRQAEALKGIAIGALAGLIGGLVMNQFQNLWSKLTEDESDSEHAHPPRQPASRQQLEGEQRSQEEEEPATVKTADVISREVFDHKLTKDERRIAGPAVHYTFSATTGMVYGALAELTPAATIGFGLPFGAAVWAIAGPHNLTTTGYPSVSAASTAADGSVTSRSSAIGTPRPRSHAFDWDSDSVPAPVTWFTLGQKVLRSPASGHFSTARGRSGKTP